MKILGGKHKGRNFFMPKDIRSTQNITRKALFDICGQDMEGIVFLDLFAGSGAMGLEALSRGARQVIFVEKDARCAGIIEDNLALFNIQLEYQNSEACALMNSDAFAVIKLFDRQEKKFDIIFMDPPYGRELAKKALKILDAYAILTPHCVIVIQHDRHEIFSKEIGKFSQFSQRKYGSSRLSFYKKIL